MITLEFKILKSCNVLGRKGSWKELENFNSQLKLIEIAQKNDDNLRKLLN